MFYSHEILANPQYGVATVWLAANNRKLNRKAIESVNVPRACTTIEKPPGAPIALRLQGNLLYGVSGVYLRKHTYLLDDTEKMWSAMRAFYRSIKLSASTEIDAEAGKAKRTQLILVDDPKFVPDIDLPPLDFDENGELLLPGWDISQRTKPGSQLSQFSPFESGGSSRFPAGAPFINLDIRRSSSHGSLGTAASPFGRGNQKPDDGDITMELGDEEMLPFGDFGLTIDADGNLVEQPEPELPPYQQSMEGKVGSGPHLPDDEGLAVLVDEDTQVIFGDSEQHLPEAALAQQIPQQDGPVPLPSEELPSSDSGTHVRHQRKARHIKRMAADSATHVSREEFKGWDSNYVTRIVEARNATRQVTAAQARKNAYGLTFGIGIMGIGALDIPGLDHPLAQLFSGSELQAMVMGDPEEEEKESQGRRRRSASDAFDGEDEGAKRRVRARPDGDAEQEQQIGRNQEQAAQIVDDSIVMFDEELLPEAGRENPGSAMSDRRRSSNAPWNRPSSVIPSSIRSQKGIDGGRYAVEGSPLVGRGSNIQADPKFSDGNIPIFGSDGLGLLPGDAHHFDFLSGLDAAAGVSAHGANTTEFTRKALDREGDNFFGFVARVAADRGENDESQEDRRWVDLDSLFEPQDQTKAVMAQAFLHVLTLATKGQIKIKQEGVEEKIPFGDIRVGVTGPFEEFEEFADVPDPMEGVEEAKEE